MGGLAEELVMVTVIAKHNSQHPQFKGRELDSGSQSVGALVHSQLAAWQGNMAGIAAHGRAEEAAIERKARDGKLSRPLQVTTSSRQARPPKSHLAVNYTAPFQSPPPTSTYKHMRFLGDTVINTKKGPYKNPNPQPFDPPRHTQELALLIS